MSNLFSLSYSNKNKTAILWDEKTIAFTIFTWGEAYFCDEKMKIAGSDRKYLSSEYCRLIVLGPGWFNELGR